MLQNEKDPYRYMRSMFPTDIFGKPGLVMHVKSLSSIYK